MSKLSNQACLGSLESDEESEVERMLSESPRIQAEDRSCNVRGPFSLGSHDVGGCALKDLYQRSSTPSKDGVYRDAKPTAFPLLPAKWDDINGLENSDSEDGICEFDPIAKRVQSSSPQLSQPTYDTRKRKAAVLEAEEPFQLEAGDIDAILTPLRDAVCSSFPVASANSGETSKGQDVCSSRVCLPALVATRLLDCDPSSRSEDPSVQAAIRSVMGSSRGRKKARGTDTRNIFAECNDLVPTRSQHLAQAKDPGSVLQYVEAVTKGSNLDGNEQPLTKVPISIAMEDHKHGPLLDKPTQDCAKSTYEKAKEYRAHTDKLGLAKRYNTHTAVNVQAVRGFAVNKDLRITKTGYSGEHLPSGSKGRDKEKVVSLWRWDNLRIPSILPEGTIPGPTHTG
ncbi:hypothetical protein K474DRAFT_1775713 [Panus rudis PR-1116 ss-1]|nr:hypothetical protein K474DRAFT_1775713 [Panus rudis PR-1116 ss-1]